MVTEHFRTVIEGFRTAADGTFPTAKYIPEILDARPGPIKILIRALASYRKTWRSTLMITSYVRYLYSFRFVSFSFRDKKLRSVILPWV